MIKNWLFFSIVAGVLIAGADSINKYLIDRNVNILVMLFYKFLFALIITSILLLLSKKEVGLLLKPSKKKMLIMFLGAIVTTLLIYSSFKAVEFIPNAAYSSGIKGSVAVTTLFILSLIFFNGHYNIYTISGLVLILVGGNMIRLNS